MPYEIIRIINLTQRKYLLIFKWNLYFINITIVDENLRTFKGQIQEDGLKALSSKVKQKLEEYWTNTLNLFKSKERNRNDLDIQYDEDDSKITFKWKKVSENSLIKQQLGFIELSRENVEDKFTVFDVLCDVFLRQEETNDELKNENNHLLNDCQQNKQNLDVLISKTSDLKKTLLSKFSSVLNAKKKKIIELTQNVPSSKETKTDSKSDNYMRKISKKSEASFDDKFTLSSPKNSKKIKKGTPKTSKVQKRKNTTSKPLTLSDLETESENEEIKAGQIIEDILKKGNEKKDEEDTIELSEESRQQTEVKLTRLRKRKSDTESSMKQSCGSEEKKKRLNKKEDKKPLKKEDESKPPTSCREKDGAQKGEKWISVGENEDLLHTS